MSQLFGAIDLGASSGRVIAAEVSADDIVLTELHRFPNDVKQVGNKLFWDFNTLFENIETGLAALGKFAASKKLPLISVGVDSWAVDYGLIDADGNLLAQPRCYRDPRNAIGVSDLEEQMPRERVFELNGLQFQPFNTIYQLASEQIEDEDLWSRAKKVLLLPDLIGYLLTGNMALESTNASTTGLVNPRSGQLDPTLLELIRSTPDLFAEINPAGSVLGPFSNPEKYGKSFESAVVTLVGSHDTASAVVGVPSTEPNFAYISSGTWSLIGLELDTPIISKKVQQHNFTNELGVDSKIRFLKNLNGLWLLSESLRVWREQGKQVSLAPLLERAAHLAKASIIDVNDPIFMAPGDMPTRISDYCRAHNLPVPTTPVEITRCIMDSLAHSYAETIKDLNDLSGSKIQQINIVGGGSQNGLLCQLTADATGLKVIAGPVEATALGNILIQARAHKVIRGDLSDIRRVIRRGSSLTEYSPSR